MEIIFKADKKHRDKYFTSAHFAHPAKMGVQLQRWLIERYTKPGDIVADVMAGSGTILIACTMGRHVICVELESKFVKMMQDNWAKIQTIGPEMGYTMGTATILQGDARNLTGLLANIGHCIFSPPYADISHSQGDSEMQRDIVAKKHTWAGQEYSDNPSNIGNLPYGSINHIVTSPPYEGSEMAGIKNHRTKHLAGDKHHSEHSYNLGNEANIGNLKSTSYLEAMLQVYQQCYAVLRPGGLLLLVLKNFIRNQQIVRLDLDTIKLCETAGFKLIERHYRKLTTQSFWRTIYRRKYPDAPVLDTEDVLVFSKGVE